VIRAWLRRLGIHPRALLHGLFTYPRFLGRIKPALLASAEAEAIARLHALDVCWEMAQLTVPIGQRIVVIAPHPDDEAIGAGGLLLRHRGQADLHIVGLYEGQGGGALPDADPAAADYAAALVAARSEELDRAAAAVGARLHRLAFSAEGPPTPAQAARLGELLRALRPDVVALPWYLDDQRDHRAANVLFAAAADGLECMVLGYEVWTLCPPNAALDITRALADKAALIRIYETQTGTIDYPSYAAAVARVRGFQCVTDGTRNGAAEAYLALPSAAYCALVQAHYGRPGALTAEGVRRFP